MVPLHVQIRGDSGSGKYWVGGNYRKRVLQQALHGENRW